MTVSGLSFNNLQLQYQALKLDDTSLQRQNVADQVVAPATLKHAEPKQPKPNVNNENQSAFLAQLMEQMLANRIGLDKQKYDEITKKIEETQQQIDTLSEQPASPAKDKQLSILEQKLEQLNDALESLVEQANRNREQKERTELAAKDLLEQYHSPSAAQRVKNSFFV